ncbi:hypothetical protein E3N88_30598 [Mikania micrantha]|uniref:SP-RING-type domain-containing protein n=1 Tax=Mikania micrantha TaxID=192012 RepID=A0A5N6MQ27_9ASTR|nr:hypothetical protein E3N88_30598 [Mikania micrantha]
MTGTVARPTAVAGMGGMPAGQTLSPLYVNSFRISAVTSRLLAHVRGQTGTDKTEFCNLCLSLARGVDYAVSNNDVPGRAPDLPYLLKQVCLMKNDLTSLAAIMVLMISVKSACSNGWFSEKIKEELYALSDEMQSNFCSVGVDELNSNVKDKESNLHPSISTIMSRFYPGMKMGEIFSLVETKPGYDSYVTDLHISKGSRTSPHDKIYLFVAQTDNIDTSACLISPQQVNILLNGEGVDKRTCVSKDLGPQMPTHVTHMLKYGTNLLQVVGQFNGRYIIVIAFMNTVSNPSVPTIDYVEPVAAQPDSDNEIVEGPSRISLKCPISFGRIKIPVKGHSCKHLQCFDFNNYVEINSRRPLWRCPHCSQSVCFNDIRVDQSMVKVLKEVGEDVSHVKISGDGSWEAVTENNSNELTEKPNDAQPLVQETTTQIVDDIMDLTENDNEYDKFDKDYERKPSPAGESSELNKNILSHMEDRPWRDLALSDIQRNHLIFNSLTQSQSQAPVSSNMQSQPNGNSNNNISGHVRFPAPATWVTRTPNAIQALPAQNSSRVVDGDRQQDFSRSHLNRHMSSLSQSHTFPPPGTRTALPQSISGNRHTSPLSTHHFSSNQKQSLFQRAHLPIRSGQPAPHVRLGAHGGMGSMTSHSPQYSLAAIQRANSLTKSQTPSIPPSILTPGSSSVPVATAGDKRGNSADGSADENWRPTGRMRGSLSGLQYTEALKNQIIIQPSQPVQAARPPPILNTPRPFIPPHLQALMANNNPRPPAGGSSPGLDSSMAGAGDGDGGEK